jgi:hypothetical protein
MARRSAKSPRAMCDDCTTRVQEATHDLHVKLHADGARGCAGCRRAVLIVAEALNYGEGHVLPPAAGGVHV